MDARTNICQLQREKLDISSTKSIYILNAHSCFENLNILIRHLVEYYKDTMNRPKILALCFGLAIILFLCSLYHASQHSTKLASLNDNFIFFLMLLGLLILILIRRKKSLRIAAAAMLGLLSYLVWFSTIALTEYTNMSLGEQRAAALLLWCLGLYLVISKSTGVRRRKQFTQLVKNEVIHNQKNRCATCKRKLRLYGSNFDHVNGDRSDNRFSNCKALCIPCHRRKHANNGSFR